MALFAKGIRLTQHKEPALSSKLIHYTTTQPQYFQLDMELPENLEDFTPREIIAVARDAQIYDERDGRLLVSKLRRVAGKGGGMIVDAIDDEPYVSSKMAPLLQLTPLVEQGIQLCQKVVEAGEVNIQTYRYLGEIHTPIPSKIGGYSVEKLGGGYPALPSLGGGTGRRRGHQGEVLIVGTGALVHLARAATHRIPQTTTFITVAGNAVASPMNMEVSLGTTVAHVLERAGVVGVADRIIVGGPMKGIAIADPEKTLITATTRSILAVRGKTSQRIYECINCGRCEEACPVGLNPRYIHSFVDQKYYSQMETFDAEYCVACGTCSYVCPSRLDLLGAMLEAKEYALEKLGLEDEEDDVEL